MRKLFFLSLLAAMTMSCAEKQLNLNFTLEGGEGQELVIFVADSAKYNPVDTLKLEGNSISWTYAIKGQQSICVMQPQSRNGIYLFVDNSDFNVSGEYGALAKANVETTSEAYAEFKAYQELVIPFNQKIAASTAEYNKLNKAEVKDEAKIKEVIDSHRAVKQELDAAKKDFIKANNTKQLAAYVAFNETSSADFEQLKEMLEILDPSLSHDGFYQAIKAKYDFLERVSVGKPAPDFTLNDPEGNPISLSSFKGKILLLDFWASWCGPCRAENPNVVKAYGKYHDKGFEILGVSLDTGKDKWLKAIKDDGLVWNHVSELKGWKGEVSALYGVKGIPHTVLIDREGTIIAKNLRGEALVNKLAELLEGK
ncbi:MAG: TlpA family protein disulfide reductase [Mangrovibacterium sp.]